ncbi:MAG: ABC transporter ATP-binding protein [Lachnospiraceae bacterium]|nr:ABC transporter ATP-binding protein [Lachnospiraceae bacterium]
MELEVRNGCFGYGDRAILKDINFKVGNNTVMTILGPNGVGKTTLLKCIMNFLKWKSGECLMDGKVMTSRSMKDFWQKTSYVPQAKQSAFSYKVIDAVIMGLNSKQNFFAVPSSDDYEKAYEVLKTLGVEKLTDKYCNALSGGELQMVMMARALISEPELMILDEPESNLDMKNQLMIVNTIERVAEEFKTSCLINTHFPNHALKISDTTLMMGYGNKQLMGKTLDIVTEENIQKFFGVCSKVVPLRAGSEDYYTIFPYKIAE